MLLVVLEHTDGQLDAAALEALTAAQPIADAAGLDLNAVVLGSDDEGLAEQAAPYGADTVYLATADLLDDYGPEAWGETVAQLVREHDVEVLLTTGTDRGQEILAQAAARLDQPFVANCTSIDAGADQWSMTRVQWGGSLLEDATLDADVKIVSIAHHAVEPAEADLAGDGATETFNPDLDDELARTVVKDRVVLSAGVTLATAPVVVSGGRGVGSAEAFAPLEELADLLGGKVGCSRAVTNNGWRNHSDQVGQTGTRIAPEIYIATGISGAIQHWVGAMASKNILAINTDAEANMVVKAGYAVIGDLHEVVPAISEEIRKRRG